MPSCPWGSLQPHLGLFKVLSSPLLGKVTWSKTIPWQLFVACWVLWELRHKPAKNERARPNAKKTKEEIALFTMINCQMVKIKTSLEFRRSINCLTLSAESEVDLMKIFSLDSVQTIFFSSLTTFHFPSPPELLGVWK